MEKILDNLEFCCKLWNIVNVHLCDFSIFPLFFVGVFRVTPVLGYQPQELLGKSAFDFYHPEDQAPMKDSFEQGKARACNLDIHVG